MESYIVDCLATCVTLVAYFYEELPNHLSDVYFLKRKRKSETTGDGPSRISRPPTKIVRTSKIMRDTMGP